MTTPAKLVFLLLIAAALNACELSDAERCDGDLTYVHGTCQRVYGSADTGNETDTGDRNTGPEDDAGLSPDAGDTPPTDDGGFGRICGVDEDCAGQEASFCVRNPASPDLGYCTFPDCTVDGDDCPGDTFCCDFPDAIPIPNYCSKPDDPNNTMCTNLK